MVKREQLISRVAKNVRMYRAGARLSQEELADKAGLSAATVANIESEKFEPKMRTIYAIAVALGCTTDDLCGFQDES